LNIKFSIVNFTRLQKKERAKQVVEVVNQEKQAEKDDKLDRHARQLFV